MEKSEATRILEAWDSEGQYAEWYAVDSYDQHRMETRREMVGTREEARQWFTNHSKKPIALSSMPFRRWGFIPNGEARRWLECAADGVEFKPEADMFVSSTQAAKMLGLTRGRVHQLVQAGELEAVRVGRSWNISVDSIKRRM